MHEFFATPSNKPFGNICHGGQGRRVHLIADGEVSRERREPNYAANFIAERLGELPHPKILKTMMRVPYRTSTQQGRQPRIKHQRRPRTKGQG